MINITLPDGSVKSYEHPVSAYEIAKEISPDWLMPQYVWESRDQLFRSEPVFSADAEILFHTFKRDRQGNLLHTALPTSFAQAVKQLFPEVKVTIGPAIEQGFYYDFDRDDTLHG